jgi:DNA-directed RNA polymerase subunit M/transcription elongation factor TFIIS
MISTNMSPLDPMGELLRIAEHYRRMSDDEIRVLMPQRSELTTVAQQALETEARQRGLKFEAVDAKDMTAKFAPPEFSFERQAPKFREPASSFFPQLDSSEDHNLGEPDHYEEDRKLTEICKVYSERDALKVQDLLDGVNIPFFMGPEKATGVDAVTSDFTKGVVVEIMQIGYPWAGPAMRRYEPEDDPDPKEEVELEEQPVRCPRCHSTEVVFEGLDSKAESAADEASQKFEWQCDSCGNRWEDDGVVGD